MIKALLTIFGLLALSSLSAGAQTPAYRTDGAPTVSLAATTASARVQFQTTTPGAPNLRIYNSGTVPVFVQCGDVTATATATTSMPIAPGTVEVIGCQFQYLAGITASGTATLYVTPGTGI